MMTPTVVMTTLANAVAKTGSTEGDDINPVVTGAGAFILLCILLLITLQFNKDR